LDGHGTFCQSEARSPGKGGGKRKIKLYKIVNSYGTRSEHEEEVNNHSTHLLSRPSPTYSLLTGFSLCGHLSISSGPTDHKFTGASAKEHA
jgi:hypothetical protein